MGIEQWVPTIVAGGALAMVWFGFKAQRKESKEEIAKMITEDSHSLLCENASLKINEHLTKEMTKLKDDIFGKLRDLETVIKDNGK